MKTITKITKPEPSKRVQKKKLKVAAYCRVSTSSDEQLDSLEAQKKHYEQTISKNDNWEFAGVYYDEGITGTKKIIRPGLMQLLDDAKAGKVGLVLTKSVSRFSRDTIDCLDMVRSLFRSGVGIYFERENIDTRSMEDEFILTVLGSLAENESLSTSLKEKWSIQKRFQNGTFKQCMAPYGYYMDDGDLVIDEAKAPVVRFIFAEALKGLGAHKIAKELNEKGIPAMFSKNWSVGTIKGMLQNERYAGDALYQKTYSDDNFVRHVNRGECDQYLHQNHHEGIVTREEFDRVQELIEQHRKEKNINSESTCYLERYPLSGLIVCEECGGHFKRRIIHGRVDGAYIAWACGTHLKNKDHCSMKAIPQTEIETAFTNMINKLIYGRERIIESFVKSIQESDSEDACEQIEAINRELEDSMKNEQVLESLRAKNLLDTEMHRKAKLDLTAHRSELNSRKEMLTRQIAKNYDGTAEGEKLLHELRQLKPSTWFPMELMISLLKAIHVYSRSCIGFELKCGLIFREEVRF